MNHFLPSELVLNADSSVYHLKLLPEDIADFIIVVGDQNRVSMVSKYFDKIEIQKSNREFVTHTGYIGKRRLSVISTGIGVDNIDIIFNELDILSSIDLKTKKLKKTKRLFKIIRLGTTGALNKKVNIDDILFSKYAIGIDGIPYHYQFEEAKVLEQKLSKDFQNVTHWPSRLAIPYAAKASDSLWDQVYEEKFIKGITLTLNGFYGPQNRQLRIPIQQSQLFKNCEKIKFKNLNITNLEMETAGLYAFGKIFKHEVLSINAVLANRIEGNFSKNPYKTIKKMIEFLCAKIESIS